MGSPWTTKRTLVQPQSLARRADRFDEISDPNSDPDEAEGMRTSIRLWLCHRCPLKCRNPLSPRELSCCSVAYSITEWLCVAIFPYDVPEFSFFRRISLGPPLSLSPCFCSSLSRRGAPVSCEWLAPVWPSSAPRLLPHFLNLEGARRERGGQMRQKRTTDVCALMPAADFQDVARWIRLHYANEQRVGVLPYSARMRTAGREWNKKQIYFLRLLLSSSVLVLL